MPLLRKIYYSLPPGLRFFTRYLIYYPIDIWESLTGKRNKNIPPKRMIYTGGGDFLKIGTRIIEHIRQQGIITPSSDVLDIGSGIGRIAVPLTGYMTDGRYEGFDIIRSGVKWCEKNISRKYPNFRFRWVSLSNDLYRNEGNDAGQFVFPYADNSFDLAVSISVFTHMLPAEVENYMREINRVLKKGGHAYTTFFILNQDSLMAMKESDEFNFRFDYGEYSLLNEKVKSANVAYRESYLDALFEKNNLQIISKEYGSWSGAYKNGLFDFQDVVITRKAGGLSSNPPS